jgi:Leucine-rich repeat (LRR) protein
MRTYTDLSEALKEPDKVQTLDLNNQGLTEIPVEIFQLINLIELRLAGNQIKVIPPSNRPTY